MNLNRILAELKEERRLLQDAIERLEQLSTTRQAGPQRLSRAEATADTEIRVKAARASDGFGG